MYCIDEKAITLGAFFFLAHQKTTRLDSNCCRLKVKAGPTFPCKILARQKAGQCSPGEAVGGRYAKYREAAMFWGSRCLLEKQTDCRKYTALAGGSSSPEVVV